MKKEIRLSAVAFLLFTVALPLPAQRVQQEQPEEYATAVYFAKKFFEMRDYVAAYEQLAKADAVLPDQPGVLYNMALILAKAGRYSDAQVKVDRYLQLFPNGAERESVLRLQLDLNFQRELQKRRLEDAGYVELFNRAQFLYGKKELNEALRLYQEAEQKRPGDAAAVFNQAVIHEKLGDIPKALERYQRYSELETDPELKTSVGPKIFELQSEIEDQRTKIVCSFCGLKLPAGATWCHRCWHGPYTTGSPVWNSRSCQEGVSVTRAMYYADGRLAKNDSPACLYPSGSMREELAYSASRQRAIQDARKAEGWTYRGDIIEQWSDKQGNQIRFHQGTDYLEKITATGGGEILTFAAHQAGDSWLLDEEEMLIDGVKYVVHSTFDANNRLARQQVDYQNSAACNHLITLTADYVWEGDRLASVSLTGGYDGYVVEGSPKVTWKANVSYVYDAKGRLAKEEFSLAGFEKIYNQKAVGHYRDEIERFYPRMRVRRPVENITRTGDVCATAGNTLLANEIDLRPFYLLSPNLSIAIPRGVTRITVSVSYVDSQP
ncbi:MAG TPA: tetratricopeptide repeat protein [Thermoanaerobaculia bacterium]|nr:tetratricopeptide repeat protein [Thermoanaerobaculia bacterium]